MLTVKGAGHEEGVVERLWNRAAADHVVLAKRESEQKARRRKSREQKSSS